jgi:phenylpropionate dioxygenase-like ring-hydroxylating dioxygenase large terminal subunit
MSVVESPRVVGPLPLGLPMPRNAELLAPGTARVRVRTVTDRFPFPIPNGWFAVARSAELAPGSIEAVHYFGRDLVLFRTDGGEARVFDAYCPHLGAHLAVGGTVRGDNLACPFHGWTFDGASGTCVEIPYATTERIPARAAVRSYPVVERNGLVFAWYHAKDGPPFYEVPEVPEFDDPAWLPPHLIEFRIATSCQEMAENNHDHAHFKFVHGTDAVPTASEHIEGTYKRIEGGGLVRETFGLGLGVLRMPGTMTFLSTVSPLDDDNVHVRWIFTAPAGESQSVEVVDGRRIDTGPNAAEAFARAFGEGVSQDIPIWENKVYRERPVLTKGEAGIVAHRTWAAQFYS